MLPLFATAWKASNCVKFTTAPGFSHLLHGKAHRLQPVHKIQPIETAQNYHKLPPLNTSNIGRERVLTNCCVEDRIWTDPVSRLDTARVCVCFGIIDSLRLSRSCEMSEVPSSRHKAEFSAALSLFFREASPVTEASTQLLRL